MTAPFITISVNRQMIPNGTAGVSGGKVTATIPHPMSVQTLTRITL
jgi:hypothetical protein